MSDLPRLKILLMGDASNCHRCLAEGLRRLGQDVAVASDGNIWMHTCRDIDITRRSMTKLGGAWYTAEMAVRSLRQFRGFDVVAISNPVWLALRPWQNLWMAKQLKRHNGSLFLTALGTDTPYVEECLDSASELKYNEFRIFGRKAPHALLHPDIEHAWLTDPLRSHCRRIYDMIDGAVSVLYEYNVALRRTLPPEKYTYGGIPIDISDVKAVDINGCKEKLRFFLGRHSYRQDIKGTDLLERAARTVVERHPSKAELVIVEDRPYAEYIELLRSGHVVLDQIYSYSPSTNPLLAMAAGQVVVSGGEPQYYDFIGERELRPIINAPVELDALTETLERTFQQRGLLPQKGVESRAFAERHNACETVARRFLSFYIDRLSAK